MQHSDQQTTSLAFRYRNTKQVYDVPVVTNRGEHVMRSAGAGARDAGRCTDLAADDELLLWASKYADARALLRVRVFRIDKQNGDYPGPG